MPHQANLAGLGLGLFFGGGLLGGLHLGGDGVAEHPEVSRGPRRSRLAEPGHRPHVVAHDGHSPEMSPVSSSDHSTSPLSRRRAAG